MPGQSPANAQAPRRPYKPGHYHNVNESVIYSLQRQSRKRFALRRNLQRSHQRSNPAPGLHCSSIASFRRRSPGAESAGNSKHQAHWENLSCTMNAALTCGSQCATLHSSFLPEPVSMASTLPRPASPGGVQITPRKPGFHEGQRLNSTSLSQQTDADSPGNGLLRVKLCTGSVICDTRSLKRVKV